MAAKKILFLVTEASYFLSHRLPIATAVLEQGNQVIVASRTRDLAPILKEKGFQAVDLKYMSRSAQNPYTEVRAIVELFSLYRRLKPDLVHHVAMKPVLYGTIAALCSGVQSIVNALAGLGYLFISSSRKARLLKNIVALGFRFLFSFKKVHLIVQNKDDVEFFRKLLGKSRLHLIRGSGVNLERFKQKNASFSGDQVLKVGLAARLLWDKGIGEAIEAVRLLKKKERKIQLFLAGGIDLENPSAISEEMVRKWVAEGACTWKGHLVDMNAFFQEMDVAILPSYREGLPKALLEAAACGLPLIAADVPGCREVVLPGENGFLVPARNAEKLAEDLERFFDHPELCGKYGEASREMVAMYFQDSIVIKQTLDVYRKVGC